MKNSVGWTPLSFAATKNNEPLVRLLLENGAYVNEPENDGWTPLLFAVFREYYNIALLLFDYGANPFIECAQGYSPFGIASERNQEQILEAIQKYREHREQVDLKNIILLDAAMAGDLSNVDTALSEGAEANVANSNGYTPLIAGRSPNQSHSHTHTQSYIYICTH